MNHDGVNRCTVVNWFLKSRTGVSRQTLENHEKIINYRYYRLTAQTGSPNLIVKNMFKIYTSCQYGGVGYKNIAESTYQIIISSKNN